MTKSIIRNGKLTDYPSFDDVRFIFYAMKYPESYRLLSGNVAPQAFEAFVNLGNYHEVECTPDNHAVIANFVSRLQPLNWECKQKLYFSIIAKSLLHTPVLKEHVDLVINAIKFNHMGNIDMLFETPDVDGYELVRRMLLKELEVRKRGTCAE